VAFQRYIEENHYADIRPRVAFSGTVRDPASGDEYTEPSMMQRMTENDGIVTRYMDDSSFQKTIFPILAKEIYKSILEKQE
jgi:hypothetical protein